MEMNGDESVQMSGKSICYATLIGHLHGNFRIVQTLQNSKY